MSRKGRANSKLPENSEGSAPRNASDSLSPRKKLLFGFVGFVLLPVLLLWGAEALLRVMGVGYATSYFVAMEKDGATLLTSNERFGWRFFPPQIARSPAPLVIPATKTDGVYRVFVFGESAAQGDPRPAYGASRYLDALLAARYPSNKFEVINTSMTAINSHGILPIARECARLKGDAWILYMGNNEMVGPFGATTVFGAQSPSATYVRFSLWLQSTRLGQGVFALARRLVGLDSGGGTWGGMSMFLEHKVPPDAPRKAIIYKNFRRNLADIIAAAKEARAHLLLNTVAVNLSDCAPFASAPSIRAQPDTVSGVERDLAQAAEAKTRGDVPRAGESYLSAVSRNSGWAEADYQFARFLELQGIEQGRAASHFQKACDLDALPFRADGEINAIIRQEAGLLGERGQLLDAAHLFNKVNGGAAGTEAFFEHVHFNFDGNYRLALAWAEQISTWVPPHFRPATPTWASQAQCEERLALTDWNRRGVLRDLLRRMSQPPFTGQSDHALRVEKLRAQIDNLRPNTTSNAVEIARQIYLRALQHAPDDFRLREGYAEFLEDSGSPREAATQWTRVAEAFPAYHVGFFHAGRLLLSAGDLPRAEANLARAVLLRPELAEGWLLRGQIQAMQGRHELALELYKKVRELAPGDERAHYHIGKSLCALKRQNEGMNSFREALRLRPNFWEARYAMAEELAFSGKVPEATMELEIVLQQNPSHVMAYINLGVARFQQGRQDEARRLFARALELDPGNQRAARYLRELGGSVPTQ